MAKHLHQVSKSTHLLHGFTSWCRDLGNQIITCVKSHTHQEKIISTIIQHLRLLVLGYGGPNCPNLVTSLLDKATWKIFPLSCLVNIRTFGMDQHNQRTLFQMWLWVLGTPEHPKHAQEVAKMLTHSHIRLRPTCPANPRLPGHISMPSAFPNDPQSSAGRCIRTLGARR